MTKPRVQYDDMTFNNHIEFIRHEKYWSYFEPYFKPDEVFLAQMESVRDIRNQLMHFRGDLDSQQAYILQQARSWLENRPRIGGSPTISTLNIESKKPSNTNAGKYEPLRAWLLDRGKRVKSPITLSFSQLEEIIGSPLPLSAHKHIAFWANDAVSHSQSLAWMKAGWRAESADLTAQTVTFRKTNAVLNHLLFADLKAALIEQFPGITRATPKPSYAYGFGAGRTGLSFSWTFGRTKPMIVELYIDAGEKAVNEYVFEQLAKFSVEIENKVTPKVYWDKLEDNKVCRIYALWSDHINLVDEAKRKALFDWALQTMIEYIEAFKPLLPTLQLTPPAE